MYLIADSGSTKTEWCITDNNTSDHIIATSGINPVFHTEDEICHILHTELIPQIHSEKNSIEQIYFYGAGCTETHIPVVTAALSKVFSYTKRVFVGSDLLGAAHALCGNNPGIACILGTGANSCLYDGKEIIRHTPPLGFILGDEGSGAYIGKTLANKVLRHQIPDELYELFMKQTALTPAAIIQKVYREPMPNRFLASLSEFCYNNRHHKDIRNILIDSFDTFFKNHVNSYNHNLEPHIDKVNFVGSIAYYYIDELTVAASQNGFSIGKVIRKPIGDLTRYRINSLSV